MKKIILFVLVINSLVLYSFSHQDSLIRQFEQQTSRIAEEDFQKAKTIVRNLIDIGHHSKAEEFANTLLKESIESKKLSRQALVYNLLGYTYVRRSSFEEALEYYKKSLQSSKQINDKKGEASSYGNISSIYYDLNNYKQSLHYAQKQLAIAKEIMDNKSEKYALSAIGNIYGDQKNHIQSLKYHQKALKISLETKEDLRHISNTFTSIGITKQLLKENDSAIYYLNQALSYALPDNKYTACYATRYIARVYIDQGNTEKAMEYFEQSLMYAKEIKSPFEIMLTQAQMARMYINQNNTKQAILFGNEVLDAALQLKSVKIEIDANKILYEAYQQEKYFEKALEHYKKFKAITDSLHSLEEKKLINDLQTQIKIDEEAYQLKAAHTAQKNKLLMLSVIPVFFILVLLIYFYYRTAAARKEFNLSLKKVEFKAQEQLISNIHDERKRISQDVHDDLGASITGMQIFTEMITDRTTNPELKKDMDKLLFMQKEITSKVREVIWFIKNEDSLLENLIKYCKNYGENLFSNYPITISIVFPQKIPDIKISENDRKHFFLSYKEVLNNIIKHSKADKVFIKFEIKNSIFSIQIKDNGKGFNTQNTSSFSYGLKNIKSRMQSIKGHIDIESNQNGTLVKLKKDYSDLSD